MKKVLSVVLILIVVLSLSACGKKESFTVTFDSVGGSSVESQTVEKGECATKPSDPSKEGFTFVEWQLDGKTYNFETPVESNILLEAFYTINEGVETITIAFNSDNGEGIKTVSIAKGTAVGEPPTPNKSGYKFLGWFLETEKFDFDAKLETNTVLIAKWDVDKTASSNKTPDSNGQSTNNKNDSTSEPTKKNDPTTTTEATNHYINFKDVEGLWYVEGHDDATLKFSIDNGTWIFLDAKGFDYTTCKLEANSGRGGTEYFYDNGKFYAEEIKLEGNNKLIFTKNNKSVVFYRQKNYPSEKMWPYEQFLKAIDGYYWYLDGYDYTYLYPNVIPWYDHQCLDWDSKNINITESSLTAYEKYDYEAYRNINPQAESNTHNTLLVNPIEFTDQLISDYKMRVDNNKLYMTVGGKEYSFTKSTKEKEVKLSILPVQKELSLSEGDIGEIEVKVSPFWKNHNIKAKSSNEKIMIGNETHSSSDDGKITINVFANKTGTATLTIQDEISKASVSIPITVTPKKVTGVSLDKTSVQLERGGTATLKATVSPGYASNKSVTWTSSDTSVATVSSSGKITAKAKGTATITVKTDDGGFTAICEVTVNDPKLTVSASIGVGIYASEGSNVRGVFCRVEPSGGTGNYVSYSIKLYYNGTLVAEKNANEVVVTPIKNGTYTAEVYVKDSNGNEATATETTTISW